MSFNKETFKANFGDVTDDYELYSLEEISLKEKKSIISGPFGSNISSKFFKESGVPVIRGNNVTEDMTKFNDDGFVFVTKEKADSLNTYAVIDDLIFTAAGTIGQVGIIPKGCKYEEYIISNKQLRVRLDTQIVEPLYAYYWYSSPKMNKYIKLLNTGSTIPLINLGILKRLPIALPEIEEQKAIARILSDLDNKIEVNNKINKRLEEMAQSIFKHWFVDFEFPNEEGKPYKSSGGEMVESELGMIPKGWEVIRLGEISTISSGKRPKKKSKEKTEECFIPLIGASSIMGYANDVLYDEEILIIGRVGTHGVVQRVHYKSWPSDNTLVIKSKCYEYIYQILNLIDYQGLNVGSTQPLITQTDIKNTEVLLPDSNNLNRFELVVGSLFNNIKKNNIENEKLSNLRDILLPKLMSGEIRVSLKDS